jgi:putative PIN family toxin of toxin-antitoxin system
VQRVVVDTNIWVSALLNRHGFPAQVLTAFAAGKFTLLISTPLLDELAEVLARPRIARKYGVTRTDIEEVLAVLRERGTGVVITGNLHLCRDPDDDVVLETAFRGRANTLVSRDEDLKGDVELVRLLHAAGIQVLSVGRFLTALEAKGDP